ncbi:MAG: HPr family phosphocarrier protein [Pseudomonadota bacterium]
MPVARLKIVNLKGLHARASAKFVETVESHNALARVGCHGHSVGGDSIMGLLMLSAHQGSSIEVETTGPDADALMTALTDLVANRFGEDS